MKSMPLTRTSTEVVHTDIIPRQLVAFDLDGTLLDCRDVHRDALDDALREEGLPPISEEEHLSRMDGLPTERKLSLLHAEARITQAQRERVADRKARFTAERIVPLGPEPRLTRLFAHLQGLGVATAVVSNARRRTVVDVLDALGLEPDVVLSSEDVTEPKPSPEGYIRAMEAVGATQETTIVLEDAPAGKRAARASGARLVPVFDPADLTVENVSLYLAGGTSFDVIVPMAGDGSRFAAEGYELPKPLVDVDGEPMVRLAVRTLGLPEGRHVFLARSEHLSRPGMEGFLAGLAREALVVPVEHRTEGAACTVLLAAEVLDLDTSTRPLVVMNSDQAISWDPDAALHRMVSRGLDGLVLCFPAPDRNPKWSYAEEGPDGLIRRVAEKDPISDLATAGVYVWRRGRDFARTTRSMMYLGRKTRGEYYVCPTFQPLIDEGMRFEAPRCEMHGLGTPGDLRTYLARSSR